MPFEQARTLLSFGAGQRRAKQKTAARKTLDQARAIFETLGAALWTEKTRAELARIGGRAPSQGALTPTERRISELVAEGRSNKDVAATLFLSPKTVEAHLGNVFRKLDVRSRSQLTRQLVSEQAARSDR
jgi:DNA-binding CsgD family transcriptional regulator